MSKNTKIEWCDHSWSPWRGCTKVSAGCANCYAETLSKRNPAVLGQWGKGKPRVLAKNWGDPVRWNRDSELNIDASHDWMYDGPTVVRRVTRPTVFPSLCDWLDDEVPVEWLARFLNLIHDTPNLDWLLLTKRPENWYNRIFDALMHVEGITDPNLLEHDPETEVGAMLNEWLRMDSQFAPSNVWIGTSVEDQPNAYRRIPELLKIPAKVRFLSVEPMLGPIEFERNYPNGMYIDPLHGYQVGSGSSIEMHGAPCGKIDWVIVGGESGRGARPCGVDWIRDIVSQCAAAGVPCFVKQLGSNPTFAAPFFHADWDQHHISEGAWISKMTHPKCGDPDEWPKDLRVCQFPEVVS